jgi:hypothetical protein
MKAHVTFAVVVSVVAILNIGSRLAAAEHGTSRAARSVHLWYAAPEATIFYNEVTVEETYAGTYFCACGFGHGYFGIQELTSNGQKVVIFSVWEPGRQDDPDHVQQDRRVKVIYGGDGVEVSRFGGEGTGAKSMFPYRWKTGETYRFLVKADTEKNKTTYSAYFYLNEYKKWKHLASFQTITDGDYLKGYYSFIEDFLRNGTSATKQRRARFGNGWVRTVSGDWVALTRATFTADDTPASNVDAGIMDDEFFLATGGNTKNITPLGTKLAHPPRGLEVPP